MARDHTLAVRRAILTLLKNDAGVTALVPAPRIYPQSPPSTPLWPFIRYGAPSASPVRMSCVDGTEIDVAIHAFAKGSDTKSAEDEAADIGAAIVAALDRWRTMGDGIVRMTWTNSQLLRDGDEAGAYHAIVNVRARALG